jgi:hypothetical protein
MSIAEALAAVMRDVDHVGKDGFNSHQKFHFRGIDGVVNAVGPALRKHKVIVTPELLELRTGQAQIGSNRSNVQTTDVIVCYRFTAEDGSSLAATVAGSAMDSGDKATPKAMSVAFRTALLQALCLPTDEPDPDESTYVTVAPPSRKQQLLDACGGDKAKAGKLWSASAESMTDADFAEFLAGVA